MILLSTVACEGESGVHGALDELVKSLAFQAREYGFKSHRHYLIWGMGLLGEDASLSRRR